MKFNLLIFGVFLSLAVAVTYPLIFHLNALIIDPYDSLLITWIQNWVIHSLTTGPQGWANILNTNIFYPYQNTLAFSDYHFVSALLALPIVLIFKEPLTAFNLNLILGLALTGFSSYLLVFQLSARRPAAFLAGMILAFSTIHLNYMPHPQLFHLWLLVLPLLFLIQKRFKLFCLFFFLAVLNSALNLYFLLFISLLYLLISKKSIFRSLRWLFVSCLLVTPFLMPYFLVSRTFGYSRPITDAINFSLQLPDLANVSATSRLSSLVPQIPNATPAYFGGVVLILTLAMFIRLYSEHKNKEKPKSKILSLFLLSSLLSFILSLGPALHIFRSTVHIGPIPAIPLPYAVLYYLVPGFSGFRTPSRWIIITALSLCFALSIYFAKKITWRWAIFLSALVILEVNFPFQYHEVPSVKQFPPEQVWLKDRFVGAPIIQFPIYGWFDGDNVGVETLRMYYSTVHWHPMFNGYSGFSPKEWENHVRWLQKDFPSKASVQFLKEKGIRLVVVDKENWENREYPGLRNIKEFEKAIIYEIY